MRMHHTKTMVVNLMRAGWISRYYLQAQRKTLKMTKRFRYVELLR